VESLPAPFTEMIDLEQYRIPYDLQPTASARTRLPRHRLGEPFIKGPIPYGWVAKACSLPGQGFHVAMVYRYLVVRFQKPTRVGPISVARSLGVSEATVRRGLSAAESAGVLRIERRAGCKLSISMPDAPEQVSSPMHKPLYGPIPGDWWSQASRLPGKALQVAAACWIKGGWERSGTFEFPLASWGNLGLSRDSAGRGLVALERAELVSVERGRGRSPIVTVRERPSSRKSSEEREVQK
jgi:hypothetical protein